MLTQEKTYQESLERMLGERKASYEEAIGMYDQLEPATLELLQGRWKGFEIQTGHPLDGLLGVSGWYGKQFISPNEVHPLLFYTLTKSSLYSVNPTRLPLIFSVPRISLIGITLGLAKPLIQTRKPKARLRMVEFRGKLTATMVYDAKPIMDHFAKIDDNTVLGVMDLKGDTKPYVFGLERDTSDYRVAL